MISTKSELAFISWLFESVQSIFVLVLLVCWMSDASTDGPPQFLDATFLSSGFCNHETWDTQKLCAMLDFCAGLLFAACALLDTSSQGKSVEVSTKTMALPTAAYLFSHGYGHFQVATRDPETFTPGATPNSDLLLLAAIIYIGPISAGKALTSVGGFEANTTLIKVVSVLAVVALVAGYKIFLDNPNYALLYINVSIMLTALIPRVMFIGYTQPNHVTHRVDEFGPYFWLRMATRLYVFAILMLEPFTCGTLVQGVGGHFLFDLSLVLDAVVDLVNLRERNKMSSVAAVGKVSDPKKVN